MNNIWHSIKNKPSKEGIYVVAHFEGGEMTDFHPDYALADGYFGPNNIGWSRRIDVTHWMTYNEYRAALESIPKE